MNAASNESVYGREFQQALSNSARDSAAEIVPYVLEITNASTVVDVGCNLGDWLAEFSARGLEVVGVDGAHVDKAELKIPADRFLVRDLSEPFDLEQRFDLVVSLEVAEHLPAKRAAGFVELLVNLGPIVLFSAAVPNQGGDHHVNEQWPSYWARLFAEHRYRPVDVIRPQFWENPNVEYWYAQNSILYVSETALGASSTLARLNEQFGTAHDLVHPKLYVRASNPLWSLGRVVLMSLPVSLRDRLLPKVRPVFTALTRRSGKS